MIQNVVDLDAYARVQGLPELAPRLPALAFWDFAAAFPSIAHAWIWIAVRGANIPKGFIHVLKGIYFMNAAYGTNEGGFTFMFWILSGVLQGCPLSGLIFVLALDPILRSIQALVDQEGLAVTRACVEGGWVVV